MAKLGDTIIDGDLLVTGEFTSNSLDTNFELLSNKITEWGPSPSDGEYPSAKLVKDTINNLNLEGGGGGGGGPTTEKIIGLFNEHPEDSYDVSWEHLTSKTDGAYNNWMVFLGECRDDNKRVVFLHGEYSVPSDMYFTMDSGGPILMPFMDIRGTRPNLGVTSGSLNYDVSVIKLNYSEGGSFCTDLYRTGISAQISDIVIDCGNKAFFGIAVTGSYNSASIERVQVLRANAVGILVGHTNSIVKNCYCIDCGVPLAGDQAAGIALVGDFNSSKASASVIEGCRVEGGSFAGIGLLEADYCKIVNCHVENFGKIGIGVIGGNNNIVTNNTVVRSQFANPQNNEFGILLNETNKGIVSNNIVDDGYIVENNSSDCLVENNIGDVL